MKERKVKDRHTGARTLTIHTTRGESLNYALAEWLRASANPSLLPFKYETKGSDGHKSIFYYDITGCPTLHEYLGMGISGEQYIQMLCSIGALGNLSAATNMPLEAVQFETDEVYVNNGNLVFCCLPVSPLPPKKDQILTLLGFLANPANIRFVLASDAKLTRCTMDYVRRASIFSSFDFNDFLRKNFGRDIDAGGHGMDQGHAQETNTVGESVSTDSAKQDDVFFDPFEEFAVANDHGWGGGTRAGGNVQANGPMLGAGVQASIRVQVPIQAQSQQSQYVAGVQQATPQSAHGEETKLSLHHAPVEFGPNGTKVNPGSQGAAAADDVETENALESLIPQRPDASGKHVAKMKKMLNKVVSSRSEVTSEAVADERPQNRMSEIADEGTKLSLTPHADRHAYQPVPAQTSQPAKPQMETGQPQQAVANPTRSDPMSTGATTADVGRMTSQERPSHAMNPKKSLPAQQVQYAQPQRVTQAMRQPARPVQAMKSPRPMQSMQAQRVAQPMQPAQPTQPQPAQPQPAQPVRPMRPSQPVRPMRPMQPAQSMQPAQPMRPMQATQSPHGILYAPQSAVSAQSVPQTAPMGPMPATAPMQYPAQRPMQQPVQRPMAQTATPVQTHAQAPMQQEPESANAFDSGTVLFLDDGSRDREKKSGTGPTPGANSAAGFSIVRDRDNMCVSCSGVSASIGRSSRCVARFRGNTNISRMHALVTALGGGRFAVEDLGSANGTTVRGTRLERGARVEVAAGERFQIADESVHIEV